MRTIVIIGIMLVASGSGLSAQDLLSAAKDLYASAAYEDALATLSRVDGERAPDVARQVDEYRAFCLYALGRTREAESIAESIIRKEPLARLNTTDSSPRLESMFTDVRKRLLPSLIRDQFRAARAAFDQKSFADAEPRLVEARLMIAEAATIGVTDDTLGDLNVLIDGFIQLIRSSKDRQPPSQPAPVTLPAMAAAEAVAPSSSPAVPAATIGPRVYSADDHGVVPPVALEQRMPTLPREMIMIAKAWKVSGVLRVVIDETGRVVDATIDRAVNASLETLVIGTARQWKYVPAKKDGVPVRYVKTFALVP